MAEEERKPIAPVVKVDQSKITKKSVFKQFMSELITNDFESIATSLSERASEAICNTAIDLGCTFWTMLWKGNANNYRRYSSDSKKTTYSYSGSSVFRTTDTGLFRQQERKSYEPGWRNTQRSSIDYMDIPFDTRPEAEKVLDAMRDILDQYPSVSVADFYDLVGYNYGNNYTCNDYGWTDLSQVTVTWSRGAWYIALPRAVVIR